MFLFGLKSGHPLLPATPRTDDSYHLSGGHCGFQKCLVKDEVCLTHLWPFLANWWCERLLKALRMDSFTHRPGSGDLVGTIWITCDSRIQLTTKGLLVASGRKYGDYSEMDQLICSPLCPPALVTPRSRAGSGGLLWVLTVLLPVTAFTSLLCRAFSLRRENMILNFVSPVLGTK